MQQPPLTSHRELIVWQRGLELVSAVYKVTDKFPRTETYGLASQLQRCAVSIPSNIAEGRGRGTRKDFTQFLHIALGSTAELETQLEIAKMLRYVTEVDYNECMSLTTEVAKMLVAMISKLKANSSKL